MTIKRKLQLNVAILLICASVISGVFVGRSVMIRHAEDVLSGISQVEREVILLHGVTQSYVLTSSSEAQEEWKTRHAAIGQKLKDPQFDLYRNQESFQELQKINNATGALFDEIGRSPNDNMLRERLESQILRHSNNFADEASKVEQLIFADAENIRQRSSVMFFALIELLIVVAVGVLLMIVGTISRPITELTEAVRLIEGGDYSARAPTDSKDEIGELAMAFNSMTAKLRSRTSALEDTNAKDQELLQDLHNRVAELEDARKAMANLFEDIGDGVIVIDKNKKIIVINRVAEHMLRLNRDDVLGRNYYEVFSNQDANGNFVEEPKRPISIVLAAGQKYITPTAPNPTYYYVRSDGSKFPVSLTVTPVILNGETVGAVDIFRDVTREKEIEKLRVDFLALASHQLRTPLSGTKWLIETIRRGVTGAVSKKQQEYLSQIYDVNERMIALVYDMLDVLKIESGEMVTKNEMVTMGTIYAHLAAKLAPAYKKQGIVLRDMSEKEKGIEVSTDPEMLESIIEEFMINAGEYSLAGQVVVVSVTREGNSIIISVKDSGIGIPKDEQKKIFERFYRASNAKEYRPGGSGLGVYRASLLAEKIGAFITVDSEVGNGATFSLHIPVSLGK